MNAPSPAAATSGGPVGAPGCSLFFVGVRGQIQGRRFVAAAVGMPGEDPRGVSCRNLAVWSIGAGASSLWLARLRGAMPRASRCSVPPPPAGKASIWPPKGLQRALTHEYLSSWITRLYGAFLGVQAGCWRLSSRRPPIGGVSRPPAGAGQLGVVPLGMTLL